MTLKENFLALLEKRMDILYLYRDSRSGSILCDNFFPFDRTEREIVNCEKHYEKLFCISDINFEELFSEFVLNSVTTGEASDYFLALIDSILVGDSNGQK